MLNYQSIVDVKEVVYVRRINRKSSSLPFSAYVQQYSVEAPFLYRVQLSYIRELLASLPFERSEIESKLKQARRIISLKNAAEYEDRLIKQSEAQEMLKDTQRLVEWVENKLGK